MATKAAKATQEADELAGPTANEPEVAPKATKGKSAPQGPVQTSYDGSPAVATRTTLTMPEAHASKWWVEEGLVGETADVILLTVSPGAGFADFRVYVWDGDGSGAAKFIENGGAPAMEHKEVIGTTQP